MDIYLYSKRTDLAATTLADLNLLIAALADELDADNQATIARVTGKLETMVQADSGVPLAIYSYDDAAGTVSSWVTNAAVTVSIGLGDPDPQSGDTYASTGTTAITGSSRTATLALNTGELANALGYGTTPRRPARTFYLHIRKTESSVTKTVGLIAVEVAAGVLSTPIASLLNTPDIGAARFSTLTQVNGATITDPGTGGLAITASGTNQNINLTPSGTGSVAIPSSVALGTNSNQILNFSTGNLQLVCAATFGTEWIARSTTPLTYGLVGTTHAWTIDTGKTVGVSFTPTVYMSLSGTGITNISLSLIATTEATTAGAGSLKTAGGIYAGKNIVGNAVIVHKAYTVATLPTASATPYGIVGVSDATNAAGTGGGTAPTGGGSVKRMVYSDGSNWLLM